MSLARMAWRCRIDAAFAMQSVSEFVRKLDQTTNLFCLPHMADDTCHVFHICNSAQRATRGAVCITCAR